MPDSSDVESYGKDHLTFDCPWCGAILGVDPSHLGESFECPECHKSTKLTEENTRKAHLAEAPEDAPPAGVEDKAKEKTGHQTSEWESYGKDHRTFDCPWCGAISGVDPDHLGESFECPECHKNTKLTEENTRAAPVTEAPPDAPPARTGSKTQVIVAVVGAVVVVAAAAIALIGSGGDEEVPRLQPGAKDLAAQPTPPPEDPQPTEPPADATPPDDGTPPKDAPPPDEAPPKEAPPDEVPPDEPPPVEPQPDVHAEAQAALEAARKALADWEASHPGEMEVLRLRKVGSDLGEQVKALLLAMREEEPTPDVAREFNRTMREFIAVDEQRVRVASYLVRHLDRSGVKPHLLEGWEGLNFFAPRVRETFLEVCGAWGGNEVKEHAALKQAVVEAKAALAALESAD